MVWENLELYSCLFQSPLLRPFSYSGLTQSSSHTSHTLSLFVNLFPSTPSPLILSSPLLSLLPSPSTPSYSPRPLPSYLPSYTLPSLPIPFYLLPPILSSPLSINSPIPYPIHSPPPSLLCSLNSLIFVETVMLLWEHILLKTLIFDNTKIHIPMILRLENFHSRHDRGIISIITLGKETNSTFRTI